MGSTLGKVSDDIGCERNMPEQKMMRRHWEPLSLKVSEFLSDGIELDGEHDEHKTE